MKTPKNIFLFLISMGILFGCTSQKQKNENDYYLALSGAEHRVMELSSMSIPDPQTEEDYKINDSLAVLSAKASEDYVETLTNALGNIPTDSILVRLEPYHGYIPNEILDKLKKEDWETPIGQLAKKNHEGFTRFFEQFNHLVGQSVCDKGISIQNEDGMPVLLSSIAQKGTILVDLWASYCGPCRTFNKAFKSKYNYFLSKGIDIISISIDKNKKAYLLAKQKDNVPWQDFYDPSRNVFRNLLKTENVPIPFQFLVKDGVIVKVLFSGTTMAQLEEYVK